MKPIYKSELGEIYKGDCLEVMKSIPDNSIDCIICDLPYGIVACNWDVVIPFEPLWNQYKRITKDNSAIVLFGSEPFSSYLRLSNIKMYKYDWIWKKSHSTGFLHCKNKPLKQYEIISIFCKKQCLYNPQIEDKPKINIRPINLSNKQSDNYNSFKNGNYRTIPIDKMYPSSIIKISNEKRNNIKHPTQKPIALIEYLIKTYTNKNNLILDNCLGSGTTAVACENLDRRYIGIEKEAEYIDICIKRIKESRQQLKLFSFADI